MRVNTALLAALAAKNDHFSILLSPPTAMLHGHGTSSSLQPQLAFECRISYRRLRDNGSTFGLQEAKRRMAARPTIEDLARFKEVSPISVLHQVKAPVLLLLGAKDRRVPLADGQQYGAALRAQGGTAKIIVFPEDTHALDRPQTEFETMINMISWLQQHI